MLPDPCRESSLPCKARVLGGRCIRLITRSAQDCPRTAGITCGLDEYAIELVPLLHEGLQGLNHLCLDTTAEATVAELDPLLQRKVLCVLHRPPRYEF